MTNAEAIQMLEKFQYPESWDQYIIDKAFEALNMAISALQEQELNETQKALDTISRQAAIDAVDSETVSTNPEHFKSSEMFIKFMDDADIASFGKWQWANGFNTAVVAAKLQLKKLLSVTPKRKTGKWIDGQCSICGCDTPAYIIDWKWQKDMDANFCPNCGADMRQREENK